MAAAGRCVVAAFMTPRDRAQPWLRRTTGPAHIGGVSDFVRATGRAS
ncbi:MAG: hypothetical protein M3Z24_16295 [Chloroflexota bacterium]|nr:hypothetical protein [Chloroflexota bacterium]